MEDEKKLKKAIKSLNISNIILCSSITERKRDNVFLDFSDTMQIQNFNGFQSCSLDKADDTLKDNMYKYTYIYSAGVRVINTEEKNNDEEEDIFAQIEADFEVVYLSSEELDDKCIEVFGKKNVQYHVWPYWREFVQSSCQRLGIALITIPLYKPKSIKESTKPLKKT